MDEKKEVKRSTLDRIRFAVFRGDDFETYLAYMVADRIKPAIGDALEGLASDVIRAIFNDDDVSYSRSSRRSSGRRHDYSQHSKKKRKRDISRRRRDDDDDYDGIPSDLGPRETYLVPFKDRNDANDIIDFLIRRCKKYGSVTVADFYSEANVGTTNFNNRDWGWTDISMLRRSRVDKKDGAYRVYLPKVEQIDEDDDDIIDDEED